MHHPARPQTPSVPTRARTRFLFKRQPEITAKINSMVVFARRVNGLRRVSIPKHLADGARVGHGPGRTATLEIGQHPSSATRILLTASTGEDPVPVGSWRRKITPVLQVTLPAELMRNMQMNVGDWVYLSAGPAESQVCLIRAVDMATADEAREVERATL